MRKGYAIGKKVPQPDGTNCYTENCKIHDRGNYDSQLIIKPNAKALDAELGELLSSLQKLNSTPGTAPKVIKEAHSKWAYIQNLYDITPEGQKRLKAAIENNTHEENDRELKALKRRLTSATKEWEKLKKAIKKEEEKTQLFNSIKAKTEQTPANPFSERLAKIMVEKGTIFEETESWGGPNSDYLAKQHFEECGVLANIDIEEDYEWEMYDSYSSERYHGLASKATCNCGKEVNRRLVLENENLTTTLGKMFSTF